MSEIEKMMQKANVEKDWNPTPYGGIEEYYPPFTAEKQISLIIFLSYKYDKGLLFNVRAMDKDIDIYDFELFGECLAKLVNKLWQDLTEEEKQQVKEILEWKKYR